MRPLRSISYAILAVSLTLTPAFARGGGGGGGGHGGGGGGARGGGGGGARAGGSFGGGGFRGGGFAGGGFRGGGFGGGGFRGGGLGGRGYGYGGYRGGYGYRGYGGWGLGLGWGYPYYGYGWGYPYGYCDPVFYNCGYSAPYDYGYTYAPQPTYAPPQVSGPTVINQYYPQGSQYYPQGSQYAQPAPQYNTQRYPSNTQSYAPQTAAQNDAPQSQTAPIQRSVGTHPMIRPTDFYLIAFTNHTIQAAVSFRVEGDTLYYTTREHVEKTAPLSTVDARFSQQINRDRHVDFQLPQSAPTSQRDTPVLKAVVQ